MLPLGPPSATASSHGCRAPCVASPRRGEPCGRTILALGARSAVAIGIVSVCASTESCAPCATHANKAIACARTCWRRRTTSGRDGAAAVATIRISDFGCVSPICWMTTARDSFFDPSMSHDSFVSSCRTRPHHAFAAINSLRKHRISSPGRLMVPARGSPWAPKTRRDRPFCVPCESASATSAACVRLCPREARATGTSLARSQWYRRATGVCTCDIRWDTCLTVSSACPCRPGLSSLSETNPRKKHKTCQWTALAGHVDIDTENTDRRGVVALVVIKTNGGKLHQEALDLGRSALEPWSTHECQLGLVDLRPSPVALIRRQQLAAGGTFLRHVSWHLTRRLDHLGVGGEPPACALVLGPVRALTFGVAVRGETALSTATQLGRFGLAALRVAALVCILFTLVAQAHFARGECREGRQHRVAASPPNFKTLATHTYLELKLRLKSPEPSPMNFLN